MHATTTRMGPATIYFLYNTPITSITQGATDFSKDFLTILAEFHHLTFTTKILGCAKRLQRSDCLKESWVWSKTVVANFLENKNWTGISIEVCVAFRWKFLSIDIFHAVIHLAR